MIQLQSYSYEDTGVKWLGQVLTYLEPERFRNVVDTRVSNVDKHSKEAKA